MIKRVGFALLAAAIVAAVVVFGFWRPFAGWNYSDVLVEVQRDFGKDREVVAVEIDEGTVAFVMKADDGGLLVRHYSRHCVLHDGDRISGGTRFEGACEVHTRRVRTFTRAGTSAPRGPTVPLGEFSPDVVERLEAAGMRSLDDPVFWRGRWRFDAPLTVARSAAPDGAGIRPETTSTSTAELAVRELVGAPPVDNPVDN